MRRDVRINGISLDESNTTATGNNYRSDIMSKAHYALRLYSRHYIWFLLSITICGAIAFYMIKKSPDIYLRYTSIMIKDGSHNPGNISALRDLGIDASSPNVTNEIMVIKSGDLARQVVERLDIDMEYRKPGWLVDPIIYDDDLPAEIRFIRPLDDNSTMRCAIELLPDSMVKISDIIKDGEGIKGEFCVRLGAAYSTILGDISVMPKSAYRDIAPYNPTIKLIANRRSITTVSEELASRVNAVLRSRDASIIDIYYTDESPGRAEAVLAAIVDEYNLRWIDDHNKITESTNKFITERIEAIEKELNIAEASLADYRSENLTLDAGAQGEKALYRMEKAEDRITEINNQIYVIEYMRSFIDSPENVDSPLPLNTGISSSGIEHYLAEYNTVMQKRNSHLSHSSEQSPIVRDLTERLHALKTTISQTIDNELARLSNEYEIAEETKLSAQASVANTPHKSIYLTSAERQKQVKENLYLFLLQKKEENELSQTFTAYNCRMVEPPHGPYSPISPTPLKTCLLALITALAIPAFLLVIIDGMNTKVKDRKDVEWLSPPFMGEIPFDKRLVKKTKSQVSAEIKLKPEGFAVMRHERDMMNEAFRVVRTNLEFMFPADYGSRVVMVTSLNPASGKTFVAANLALSLAITEKTVILVDLDMRKGMISRYAGYPAVGVSSVLGGHVPDYHNLIINRYGLDILPCGQIPPNPAELLHKDTFTRLIADLKSEYDYVFIDCPPVEVVADASIINRHTDLALFVVRAQYSERSLLRDIETWHTNNRYRNLAVILNGVAVNDSIYGMHGNGYY